jgi:hypothetical protein
MSETLSYQEPAPTELNEAEQQALEVGEQMEADQNQLLAGKYKSAGDLEKAYLELQQKLGAQETEPEEQSEEQQEDTEEQQPEEDNDSDKNESKPLTQQDIDYLHGLAGGTNGYKQMITWASENMDAREIEMYDRVMDKGDAASVLFAVKALVAQYKDAVGSDGELLTGKSAANTPKNEFRSQQELVAAMNDPRYDTDPAYRSDVLEKLENSNIDF